MIKALEQMAEGYKEERVWEKLDTLFQELNEEYEGMKITVDHLREDSQLMGLGE